MNFRNQSSLHMEVIEVHCKTDATLDCNIQTFEQCTSVGQAQLDIKDSLVLLNKSADQLDTNLELVRLLTSLKCLL